VVQGGSPGDGAPPVDGGAPFATRLQRIALILSTMPAGQSFANLDSR